MSLIDFDKNRIKNIHSINDENIIVIISNEREKPYSSLKRIIRGTDKFVKLTDKDTVVIASPLYDNIEITSTKVFNQISKIGSNLVILSKKYLSPHASSEDLMMMTNLMQPKYYFPIIGEYRHQVENANLARKLGINEENVILALNGDIITFIDGKITDTDEKIKVDDILIDGKTVGDIGDLVLKDREMLSENGIVVITVTIDKASKKILSNPQVLTRGFIYVKDNTDMIKEAEKISLNVINENIKNNYVDFNKIKLGIREKLGKYFYNETSSKPMIIVVIQEV